jgi:hypothetical protein
MQTLRLKSPQSNKGKKKKNQKSKQKFGDKVKTFEELFKFKTNLEASLLQMYTL